MLKVLCLSVEDNGRVKNKNNEKKTERLPDDYRITWCHTDKRVTKQ